MNTLSRHIAALRLAGATLLLALPCVGDAQPASDTSMAALQVTFRKYVVADRHAGATLLDCGIPIRTQRRANVDACAGND